MRGRRGWGGEEVEAEEKKAVGVEGESFVLHQTKD